MILVTPVYHHYILLMIWWQWHLFHWFIFVGVRLITLLKNREAERGEAENIKPCWSFKQPGDPGQTEHVCLNGNLHKKKTSYQKYVCVLFGVGKLGLDHSTLLVPTDG